MINLFHYKCNLFATVNELFTMSKTLYEVLLKTSTFFASVNDNEFADFAELPLRLLPESVPFITILGTF